MTGKLPSEIDDCAPTYAGLARLVAYVEPELCRSLMRLRLDRESKSALIARVIKEWLDAQPGGEHGADRSGPCKIPGAGPRRPP